MKANELRIGNLVYNDTMQLGTVERIMKSAITIKTDKNPFSNSITPTPIPLTPEWLERLGFEGEYATQIPEWRHQSGFYMFENWFTPDFFALEFRNMGIDIEIKYVHQLQNLYFALTGEELKIKQ